MSGNNSVQQFQNLKNRAQQANNKLIQMQTELSSLKSQQAEIMNTVQTNYGVSTVDELRELYKEKKATHVKALADFEENIINCENKIRAVEESLNQTAV